MNRRSLICGFGIVLALPRIARAQQSRRVARIAVLWHAANAEEEGPYFHAIVQGFRELGYVEGRNLVLEYRYPNEEPEKFRSMADELVRWKPDVLLAAGNSASIAAKNATSSIPVVFIVVPDPVRSKLVENLARPGGNVTGLSNFAVQLTAKRLEYLKEAFPSITRVGLLVNPNVQITRRYIEDSEAAAVNLKLSVHPIEARTLDDLSRAFDTAVKTGMQAVSINAEGLFFQGRFMVGKLALERRMPTCAYSRETLEGGTLMSYGPDQRGLFRRSASYADRILKGAKPAEMPVEFPSKIEFLINLRTAKAMGLQLPQSLLLRADEVISHH